MSENIKILTYCIISSMLLGNICVLCKVDISLNTPDFA